MRNVTRATDGNRGRGPGLVLCLLLALLAGCGGGGSLDSEALSKEVEAIESLAAEGAVLANGAAQAKTTSVFTRVHAEELAETATEETKKLESADVDPELRPKARKATLLSTRIGKLLTQLGEASGDRAGAQAVMRRLDEAAKTAKELGESL